MNPSVPATTAVIHSVGTQVVTARDVLGDAGRVLHPQGSVGVVVKSPADRLHSYRVRFLDGVEATLHPDEVVALARFKAGELEGLKAETDDDLYSRVIFRCVIGSRAYGLDDDQSDIDYRGVYLPTADRHWSLFGVPEQIERQATQEHYWEFQRFLVLALKANPNVLECLYTPMVETATPLASELLAMRESFLSKLIYQTYNGYVLSQFRKMQADIRNQGHVKQKHVMHLIRLLISGIAVLREGYVPVRVDEYRERLLAIKRGDVAWEESEQWRQSLHKEFDLALAATRLPERPNYEAANALLLKARRLALEADLP